MPATSLIPCAPAPVRCSLCICGAAILRRRRGSTAPRTEGDQMRKSIFLTAALTLFSLAFAGFPAAALHAADLQSPVGLWKTIDDKTGKPRAIVRIYVEDGKYFGKIEQSFTPGAESRVCSMCKDERKNQPIIVLLIIRNMAQRDGEYA